MKQSKLLLGVLISGCFSISSADTGVGGYDGYLLGAVGQVQSKDSFGANLHGGTEQLRLSIAYTGKEGFGGQIDNVYDRQKNPSTYLDKASTTDVAGHFFYRNQSWLGGIFAQRRTFDITWQNSYSFHMPVDRTFYGLEGQKHLDNVTLYGQVGRQDLGLANVNSKGNIAVGEVRYFIKDNWRVDASYQYSKLNEELYTGWGGKSNVYSVGSEYRFTDTPLSIFVQYDSMHQDANYVLSDGARSNRFLVGLKMSLGKDTLKQRNNDGATLHPIKIDNMMARIFIPS